MPIYEYECAGCGTRLERLIRRPADIPDRCPKCGARKLKKAFSAFSVAAAASPSHERACSSCDSGSCPYSGGAGSCCE